MTIFKSLHYVTLLACLASFAACSSSSNSSNGAAGANNSSNSGGDGDASTAAGDGDDTSNGGDGDDTSNGGDGDDTANGSDAGDEQGGDGDPDGGMSGGGSDTETTVENYTGVTTADCESAEPACELLCNMVCNNCGEHEGQMNGCGPAQGFAESALDDGSSCGGCVDAIAAWAGTCESFSDVPAPVVTCAAEEPVEQGPACAELAECCPRAEFPYDMGCQQVADSGDEGACEAYLDIPAYCPPL